MTLSLLLMIDDNERVSACDQYCTSGCATRGADLCDSQCASGYSLIDPEGVSGETNYSCAGTSTQARTLHTVGQ